MTCVRIGVLVRSFKGKELAALKYLILEQNRHQSLVEFEILPAPDDDTFLDLMDGRRLLDRQIVLAQMKAFVSDYRHWLETDAHSYELSPHQPDRIVVISAARFSDHFYLSGMDDWTVIALGWWTKQMSPPSVVEFILTLLAGVAIDQALGFYLPSHQCSRGCVSDFTASLDEARIKSLTGYLCEDCRSLLDSSGKPSLYKDTVSLLSRDWLGSSADPSSATSIARKLGYDLFRTKGFKPTIRQKAIDSLQSELVKTGLNVTGAVLVAALILWLGLEQRPANSVPRMSVRPSILLNIESTFPATATIQTTVETRTTGQ